MVFNTYNVVIVSTIQKPHPYEQLSRYNALLFPAAYLIIFYSIEIEPPTRRRRVRHDVSEGSTVS